MSPSDTPPGWPSSRASGRRYSPPRRSPGLGHDRSLSFGVPFRQGSNSPSSEHPSYPPVCQPQQSYGPLATSLHSTQQYHGLHQGSTSSTDSTWDYERFPTVAGRSTPVTIASHATASHRPSLPPGLQPRHASLGIQESHTAYAPYRGSLQGGSLALDTQTVQPGSPTRYGIPSPSTYPPPQASTQRRTAGRDEFDGPCQFLTRPIDADIEVQETELISLPISLLAQEQDEILAKVNDSLSQSAFDFVAKYQFPIPLEADKRPVRVPADREWTEWCFSLKRSATKRRIPARVSFNGQIKQSVTVLENSLEMRHAAKHQSRPSKDDWNVSQLISAGLQVAKMLKDPGAMRYLDASYVKTEDTIAARRRGGGSAA